MNSYNYSIFCLYKYKSQPKLSKLFIIWLDVSKSYLSKISWRFSDILSLTLLAIFWPLGDNNNLIERLSSGFGFLLINLNETTLKYASTNNYDNNEKIASIDNKESLSSTFNFIASIVAVVEADTLL